MTTSSSSKKVPPRLVVFDLDSTLTDAESLVELARLMGKEEEVADLTKKAMGGEIPFADALKHRVGLLQGLKLEKVEEAVKAIPLMEGAADAVQRLKGRGIKTGIITGGFESVALRVKEELGIDYVVANELMVAEGALTGEVRGPITNEGAKGEALDALCKELGIRLQECAVVGDGANDISMFEKAGLAIAFNPTDALEKVADVVVKEKDLRGILPHILGEPEMDELLKERSDLELKVKELRKEVAEKRSILRDLGNKKRDLINEIRTLNEAANKYRYSRDELNEGVRQFKIEREKSNEVLKSRMDEYKKLQETAPKGDFRIIQKEVNALEWKLQTSVLEIKKEDEIVGRIKKLKAELKGYENLIEFSKEMDKHRKTSRKAHESILKLSEESQQYHQQFLAEVTKIKEIEAKIDELNAKKDEIAPSLDQMKEELDRGSQRLKELDKEVEKSEAESGKVSVERTEREMKEKAKEVYDKFKKGEKLDLEDIYLLRRFNLV